MNKREQLILEGTDFATIMSNHNPFGCKSETGKVQMFQNYERAYWLVLQHLYEHNRKGYVDIVLLIHELTQVNLTAALEVVRPMRGIWGKDDARVLKMPWFELDDEDISDLKMLFRCLHTITSTTLDEGMLQTAVNRLKVDLIRQNATK